MKLFILNRPIIIIIQTFSSAHCPMVIVGSEILQRQDGNALLSAVMKIAGSVPEASPSEKWPVLNILQKVNYVHVKYDPFGGCECLSFEALNQC